MNKILLSEIEMIFEIAGRGIVIVPGINGNILKNNKINLGAKVQIVKRNGISLNSIITSIESIRPNINNVFPITLGKEITKSDIDPGDRIYLITEEIKIKL